MTHHFGAPAQIVHNSALLAVAQSFGLFLVTSFVGYWIHRWEHTVPLLWAFHRCHHSAEHLTVLSTFRNHPIENLYSAVVLFLCAGPLDAVVFYFTGTVRLEITIPILLFLLRVEQLIGTLAHSHVPFSYGKLNYILSSPVMQQIHHSAEPRHFNKNIACAFCIWDWMFGTLYVPRKGETFRFGLGEQYLSEKNPHATFKGYLLEPFAYARRTLKGENP